MHSDFQNQRNEAVLHRWHDVPVYAFRVTSISFLAAGSPCLAGVLAMYQRHTGSVSSFNNLRGIGFLRCSGRADIFCHYTAICRPYYSTLMRGEAVEFEIVLGVHGEEAHNLTVLLDMDEAATSTSLGE